MKINRKRKVYLDLDRPRLFNTSSFAHLVFLYFFSSLNDAFNVFYLFSVLLLSLSSFPPPQSLFPSSFLYLCSIYIYIVYIIYTLYLSTHSSSYPLFSYPISSRLSPIQLFVNKLANENKPEVPHTLIGIFFWSLFYLSIPLFFFFKQIYSLLSIKNKTCRIGEYIIYEKKIKSKRAEEKVIKEMEKVLLLS